MLSGTYNVIKSFERRIRRKLKGQALAGLPADFDPAFKPIYDAAKPYTMTSAYRMNALFEAVKYVCKANIQGDFVECGVWRGGSMMVAAMTLLNAKATPRELYLYDTYTGMSEPSEKDVTTDGRVARGRWEKSQNGDANLWCYAPLDDVKKNLASTGYPLDLVHFVQGKVEETIPATISQRIAILRLDTDWFDSTYHNLVHLYPRLAVGGVLILDDYGAWKGAREATDQYFHEVGKSLFLSRIDDVSRVAIKTQE
jgi:O-methyltransferase